MGSVGGDGGTHKLGPAREGRPPPRIVRLSAPSLAGFDDSVIFAPHREHLLPKLVAWAFPQNGQVSIIAPNRISQSMPGRKSASRRVQQLHEIVKFFVELLLCLVAHPLAPRFTLSRSWQ